jgi:hypothetical protein
MTQMLGGGPVRMFRLTNEPGGLGLSCTPAGVSLAGVPLLRRTEAGFVPRPGSEVTSLLRAAYGEHPTALPSRLLPDMDDDGSLAAQFALNAGLVAADIAGLAEDGQNSHVAEAIVHAQESIYATATIEMQIFVYDRAVEEAVRKHPLMQKERKREEEDVTFLGSLPEAPWPQNVFSMLRDRAQAQEGLLGTMH